MERLSLLAAALAGAAADRAASPVPVLGRLPGGWRNVPSQPQTRRYLAVASGTEHEVRYRLTRAGLDAEGSPDTVLVEAAPGRVVLETAGVRRTFEVAAYGDLVHVDSTLGATAYRALPRFPEPVTHTAPGSLLAPMPGTVVRVAAALGDTVEAGQPLLWLEAMKMEHQVTAPTAGTVTELRAEAGRQVEVGTVLAVVTPAPDAVAAPDSPSESTEGDPS